jgi:hypothetical protein
MSYLESTGRTSRVERVPLCYMRWFEHFSTETRKIVKDEERIVHFLDEREIVKQKSEWFIHDKWTECESCDLNAICAGIWMKRAATMGWTNHPAHYDFVAYKPQKLSREEKEKIISLIHNWLD